MKLARQIERYIPDQVLELIKSISQQATRQGWKAYLVGGVVRDLFLGYPSFDLDIVIEGDAVKLAEQVAEMGYAKLLARHRFGTAKLKCEDFTLDLATARKETYARPGALPTVAPGTLKDDLFRRDFTINAMAVSLAANDYGELVDPYQGKSDLDRGIIRILHPKSFIDDATRILRAVRYEQRFGFELEAETAKLLKRDIRMLNTISGDRIRHELELILREKRPELPVNRLGELGALQTICPSLSGNGWIARAFKAARRLKKTTQLLPLYFCLLIYALNQKEIDHFIARLNTSAKLSQAMRDTLGLKKRLTLLDNQSLRPSEVYYLLSKYEIVALQANLIACDSSTIRRHLQLFLTKLRYVKTSLDGEDLKKLGIPPGPEMGNILQALHRAKLDGEVSTRADEKRLALSLRPNQNGKGGRRRQSASKNAPPR